MNTVQDVRRRSACIFASLFALCVFGCSHPASLVGTWRGAEPFDNGGPIAAVTYEFGSDGLMQFTAKLPPHRTAETASLSSALLDTVANIHSASHYTVKDDVLTVSTTQVTMSDAHGQPPPFPLTLNTDTKPRVLRFSVHGNTLSLDSLDGTPPAILTRQKA